MGIIYAQQGYYIYYTCFRHMWWQMRSKCLLSQERKGNYITFHHSISTLNMFHSNLASNLSLSTDKSKKWGVIRVESPVVIFSKVEPYLLNPKIKNSFFNLYHNPGGKGGRVSHMDIFQEHQLNWKKTQKNLACNMISICLKFTSLQRILKKSHKQSKKCWANYKYS